MDITKDKLATMFTNFNTAYQTGFSGASPYWPNVATLVPSLSSVEDYGWLGDIPGMREWFGDREINMLKAHTYSIANKSFEITIGVDRYKVEDGHEGIYTPLFQMLGDSAANHPDELVWKLLSNGFSTLCYDGQYFFDADHPVALEDGTIVSVSNMQAGAGNPWFLLDCTRPLRPIIFQQREAPVFQAMDKQDTQNSFMRKQFIYGIECRDNAGFGFWQMAFGSKDVLNAANFENAKAAMGALRKDNGKPMGIRPNLLVCGSSNEAAARKIVEAQLINGGESNINYKVVDLLVVPWLD